jgi:hypothetical protein
MKPAVVTGQKEEVQHSLKQAHKAFRSEPGRPAVAAGLVSRKVAGGVAGAQQLRSQPQLAETQQACIALCAAFPGEKRRPVTSLGFAGLQLAATNSPARAARYRSLR